MVSFGRRAGVTRQPRRAVALVALIGLSVLIGTVGSTDASATPPPTMTTFTETGTPYPYHMVSTASGTIYVENLGDDTVSRITAAGVLTQAWYAGGTSIVDLAVDPNGNVWLARAGSGDAVQEVSPAGTLLHTYQTQPTGLPDQIYIDGIGIDPSGNVYVDYRYGNASPFGDGVAKISAAGTVTPAWATLPTGFDEGQIVTDHTGNVYVLGANDLAKITPAGVVTAAWATPGGGAVGDAIDSAGNIYVINGDTIVKVAPDASMDSSWASVATGDSPAALSASPAGNVFVLNEDTNNNDGTVSEISAAGAVTETWATLPAHPVGRGYGNYPYGIVSDPSGNMYVSLFYGNAVVRLADPTTQPPTSPRAVAGTSSATISWDAPSPSSAITGYTVTAHPGPATCTTHSAAATSCVIGGIAGTHYTYSIVAHSAAGVSTAATTTSVVPTRPVVASTVPAGAASTLTTSNGALATAKPGQVVTVIGTGMLSYSTVVIAVYSTPIVLATVTADSHGHISTPVTIPGSLDPGTHTLVAYGVDSAGTARSITMPFTLVALAATGVPTAGLLEVGLLTLVAGVAAVAGAKRIERRHRAGLITES